MTSPVDRVSLVRRWFRLWRVEHVEIVSPLSAGAAGSRLAAGLTTRRQLLAGRLGDGDARVVSRRVSPGESGRTRGRGRCATPGARCSAGGWSVTAQGAGSWARPDGSRSDLHRCLAHPGHPVRDGATTGSAVLVAIGHGAAGAVPTIGVPAAMAVLGGGLITGAGRAGWRDADFLRGWLAERLRAPRSSEVATVEP